MTDGISRFKQMLARGQKPRRHNWRQPTTQLSTSHNSTESGLFDQLLPEQQMSTTTMTRRSKNAGATVARTTVIDAPTKVEDVELERNFAQPMKLGDELEAALAAKLMEGVLEFFKEQVREKLKTAGVTAGESEHAQVSISKGGGPSRVVNYDKFLAACRDKGTKKIPVAVRNSLIGISKGKPLQALFSDNEIDAMCDDGPASTAACTIEQKTTLVTPIGVPEAIEILRDYLAKGVITDKTFMKKKSHR